MDNCRMNIKLLMVIFCMGVISIVDAQVLPPCGKPLLPCIEYANSTSHSIPDIYPPDICCTAIKDVFDATQVTCFCQLAHTPGLFQAFGVKFTLAYRILHICGVEFDTSFCNIASSPTLPLSSVQPPATLIGDEGGAGRIALTGLCYIMFIWAFLLFD